MSQPPPTDVRLLARLRDGQDVQAWGEFEATYSPTLYRFARRFGLQDADADSLAQDVLRRVAEHVNRWEDARPPGGLRRWLATVTRNAAIDAVRRVRPDAARGGTSVHAALREIARPEDGDSAATFRRELERQAFRRAAERIRTEFAPTTWDAFWSTMVEGRSIPEVARASGLTVGAVYTARSRVMQRLKVAVLDFMPDVAPESEGTGR